MKGILHKTDKGWVVDFKNKQSELNDRLPIHPDDIFLSLHSKEFTLIEGKEVEFKVDTFFTKTGQCMGGEVERYNTWCAKLILPTAPSENNGWDDIFEQHRKEIMDKCQPDEFGDMHDGFIPLTKWLKSKFNPPTPLKQ